MSRYNAIIIIGPESSGTRMCTSLFSNSGFFGDTGHIQRLDEAVSGRDTLERVLGGHDRLVFRRSVPHNKQMPDLEFIDSYFKRHGFHPYWFIVTRDSYCTIKSKVRSRHAKNLNSAGVNLQNEVEYLDKMKVYLEGRFSYLNASALMRDPNSVARDITAITGIVLSVKSVELIHNSDSKYQPLTWR